MTDIHVHVPKSMRDHKVSPWKLRDTVFLAFATEKPSLNRVMLHRQLGMNILESLSNVMKTFQSISMDFIREKSITYSEYIVDIIRVDLACKTWQDWANYNLKDIPVAHHIGRNL